jgi:uncharacterized protein (TIGR03790 family)
MLRLRLFLLISSLLALAACGRSAPDSAAVAPAGQLPALGSLKDDGLQRTTSATEFELLGSAPVAVSPSGVATTGGELALTPALDGMAWAVYALQGLPTDGSVVPVSVTINRSLPCWLAFGDFGGNRWELVLCDDSGTFTPTATSLVSPGGTFYVAVIAYGLILAPFGGATTVSSLQVNLSADVALPEPALRIVSATGALAAGIPSHFTAEGSEAGAGAAITTITYDWNDGSPTEQVSDPLTELSHTWPLAGEQTVTLTLENDKGVVVSKDFTVTLGDPFRELLVVYNASIPESEDLMEYYCSSRNGRLISPAQILGLPLGGEQANVDRPTYEAAIRDPIKTFITDNNLTDQIKYNLLFKGVPYRIAGSEDFDGSDGITATASSVDSELCTLFDDDQYPYEAWLWNGPLNYNFEPQAQGLYLKGDVDFSPNTFQLRSHDNNQMYTLNYLVGRMSAYTFDNAKEIVDRSITADTSGTGWAILDSRPAQYGNLLDTMVDPVYKAVGDVDSGYDLLSKAGFNAFQDITFDLIDYTHPTVPAGAADNVLAYCSWGVHSGFGSSYILDTLGFTYRPGAVFMSYESYNGVSYEESSLTSHPGQGQLCDFLYTGGTVGIGNTWEPYTDGVGDERWVMDRYINHGDRWIEAAYKGLRMLSWMEIVTGDPLCKVK